LIDTAKVNFLKFVHREVKIKKFFEISARIRTWWSYRYGRNFTRNIINDVVVINFLKNYTMGGVIIRN